MYSNEQEDRERFYRCKICSCYYRRECDIELHVRDNHAMTVLSSVQKGILYTGKCKFCGSELVLSSYNKHVKETHGDIFFSAHKSLAVKSKPAISKPKQKPVKSAERSSVALAHYSLSQYGEADTSGGAISYYNEQAMMSQGYQERSFTQIQTTPHRPASPQARSRLSASYNIQNTASFGSELQGSYMHMKQLHENTYNANESPAVRNTPIMKPKMKPEKRKRSAEQNYNSFPQYGEASTSGSGLSSYNNELIMMSRGGQQESKSKRGASRKGSGRARSRVKVCNVQVNNYYNPY